MGLGIACIGKSVVEGGQRQACGVGLLQVAAANAELLERKKLDAAQQAAEDKRIAAYIADKAAREQVPVTCPGLMPQITE